MTRPPGPRAVFGVSCEASHDGFRLDERTSEIKKTSFQGQRRKFRRQGARIPRTGAYGEYAAGTVSNGRRGMGLLRSHPSCITGGGGPSISPSSGKETGSAGKGPESRRPRHASGSPQGGGMKGNAAYGAFSFAAALDKRGGLPLRMGTGRFARGALGARPETEQEGI